MAPHMMNEEEFKNTIRPTLHSVSSGKVPLITIISQWLEDVPELRRPVFVQLVKEFPVVMDQMAPIFDLCRMLKEKNSNEGGRSEWVY
jgi:hypothetical protein